MVNQVVHQDSDTSAALERLFREEPEPQGMDEYRHALEDFISYNVSQGRRVAIVSSGGTSVPLEQNVVRSVENFSTGTRGAAVAERLMEQGYAVMFLARTGSKAPHMRWAHEMLDSAAESAVVTSAASTGQALSALGALAMAVQDLSVHVGAFTHARAEHRLLMLPYVTVTDYLHLLRATAEAARPAGRDALFVLAAAVSDFYVPAHTRTQHKIQSAGGAAGLTLHLQGVPKALAEVREWAPLSTIVSFKLETDAELLLRKSVAALTRYRVDGVVANQLAKRYREVLLVTPRVDATADARGDDAVEPADPLPSPASAREGVRARVGVSVSVSESVRERAGGRDAVPPATWNPRVRISVEEKTMLESAAAGAPDIVVTRLQQTSDSASLAHTHTHTRPREVAERSWSEWLLPATRAEPLEDALAQQLVALHNACRQRRTR